ncbi:DUF2075 domain-containing protein [Opitutaceae bacterium TAV4]|nr:DUF2075 domain-containing protein [Opitutaceae bacterium TAV3]RRK01529.1 DUF2075 domain-containing protein [Opitutaceae bacterium TAV4]
MLPDYGPRLVQMVTSGGERKVYEALRTGLSHEFTVLHSVSWIARAPGDYAQDGEADFLLVHPRLGLLVIEVKGGGIAHDATTGAWTSQNREGHTNKIKNPFEQAKNAKHQILALLQKHPDWQKLVPRPICIGHAVWLPDLVSAAALTGPDRPHELILTHADLARAADVIQRAWDFAGSQSSARYELGTHGTALVEKTFARSFIVLPTAAARISDEEQKRIELTQLQFSRLKLLGPRRRVGITGGAGTGKTLLALEKAHELARNGFKTLLLVYNNALGEHLASSVDPALPITTGSFHSFCSRLFEQYPGDYLERAKREHPAKSNSDYWNIQFPAALCYLLEEHEVKFDAIIVDEAQDFADEFWFPLQCMMTDAEKTPLYLFYDRNQQLYRKTENFPIGTDNEFSLIENCRNTAQIHSVVRPLFTGGELNAPSIEGVPVMWHESEGSSEQIRQIKALVTCLVTQDGIKPQDIVVLFVRHVFYPVFFGKIESEKMTDGLHFTKNTQAADKEIRVLTAGRFKGLEAPIVIVWGLREISVEDSRMELYVALSRPKNELHMVGSGGDLKTIREYLQNAAQSANLSSGRTESQATASAAT